MQNNVTNQTVLSFDATNELSLYHQVTPSYLQNQRHAVVSERFQPIQAASIGNALAEKGFKLVSVLTGKGKHADKKDFQRTIARYRSTDAFEIDGLQLDIIYISKHMGRGCDELRLGFFRGVCANQWAIGQTFEVIKFRHSGNPFGDISNGIDRVLAQRNQLIETIKKMQGMTLNIQQIDELAKSYARIRLANVENVASVNYRELATVRRGDDAKLDLFTVANVLQENLVNMPLQYSVHSKDTAGLPSIRNMSTRRLKESSAQLVDLNAQLFDAALKLVA